MAFHVLNLPVELVLNVSSYLDCSNVACPDVVCPDKTCSKLHSILNDIWKDLYRRAFLIDVSLTILCRTIEKSYRLLDTVCQMTTCSVLQKDDSDYNGAVESATRCSISWGCC
jgi:hypothetical protein